MRRKWNWLVNGITGSRIFVSAVLLAVPVYSTSFYVIYLLGGLTDFADGFLARKTHTASEAGARLDSLADGIFFCVAALKLVPTIHLHPGILIWTGLIAGIKIVYLISVLIHRREFRNLHTRTNKLTGLLLFLLPLTVKLVDINFSALPVCVLATVTAVQEGCVVLKERGGNGAEPSK